MAFWQTNCRIVIVNRCDGRFLSQSCGCQRGCVWTQLMANKQKLENQVCQTAQWLHGPQHEVMGTLPVSFKS